MRRGTASRKRRLRTSYRDVVSRRRSATRSNQLPSCQLRLCLGMPSVDTATLHTWLHHWQDEFDAAYLYLVLAGQESDPHRKDVYIKLAGVEERHTQMWEKLLAEHGHPVAAQPRPSFNARLRAWFGRRFGPGYLLPLLLREEGQEVKGYMDLHKESRLDDAREVSLKLARESAAHAETLADLAGRASEPWHKTGSGGFLRNVVYGFNDGLTANFGLVAGVIGPGIARKLAAEVMRDSQRALDEQVREELKIGEAHATPFKEGWVTGAATAIGALIPVAPFLVLSGRAAVWTAFSIAMLSHFAVGAA